MIVRMLFVCALVAAPLAADEWWNRAWPGRLRIELRNPSEETLLELPAVVRLTKSTPGWERMQKGSIRFVAGDGKTVLPFEVAWWNAERGAEIHVRVPKVAPRGVPTGMWLYFGNPASRLASLDPRKVWSAGYVAVYHLAETERAYVDSAGTHDSVAVRVSRRDNGLSFGGGPAPDFNGVQVEPGELVDLGKWNLEGTQMSLEAFFMTDEIEDRRLISKSVGGSDDEHTWMLNAFESHLRFRLRTLEAGQASTFRLLSPRDAIATGTWYHGCGTYDGSWMRIYLDGVEVGSGTKSGPIVADERPIHLGNNPGYLEQHFKGRIDEVRISRLGRSPGWVAATSAGLHGKLCELGEVEDRPETAPRVVDPAVREKEASVLVARGRELESADKRLEALAAYEKAAEIDGTAAATAARAALYRLLGDADLAADVAKDRRDHGARRLLEAAQAARKAGDPKEAARLLEVLLRDFPQAPQLDAARKLLAELGRDPK